MRTVGIFLTCLGAAVFAGASLAGGTALAGQAAKPPVADNAVSVKALQGSWAWATTSGSEMYTFNPDNTFSYLLLLAVNSSTFRYSDMREYREKQNPYATSLFKKGKYRLDGNRILLSEVYMGGASASSGSGDSALDKLSKQPVEYRPAENETVLFEMWPSGVLRLKGNADTLFGRHGESPNPNAPLPKHTIPAEPWPAALVGPVLPEYKSGRLMSVEESQSSVDLRFADTDKAKLAAYTKQLKDKGWSCLDGGSTRARLGTMTVYFSWEGKGPLKMSVRTVPAGMWPKGTPDDIFPPAGVGLIDKIEVEADKDDLVRKFTFEADKTDEAGVERYFASLVDTGWTRDKAAHGADVSKRFRWNNERWKAFISHRSQEGDFASYRVEYKNLRRSVWPARELPPDAAPPDNAWVDDEPELDKPGPMEKRVRIGLYGMDEGAVEKYFAALLAKGWVRPETGYGDPELEKRLVWNGVRYKARFSLANRDGQAVSFRIDLRSLADAAWPARKLPPDLAPPQNCWLDEVPDLQSPNREETRLTYVCYGMTEDDEAAYAGQLEKAGWERVEEAYGGARMEKRFLWEGKRYKAGVELSDHGDRTTTYKARLHRLDAAVWLVGKIPADIVPPKDAWLDEPLSVSEMSAKGGRFRFTCYGLGEAGTDAYFAFLQSKGWDRLEDNAGAVTMEKRFRGSAGRFKAEVSRDSENAPLTTFRVAYENLDAATWPTGKIPPDIVPPQNCWLDEEVQLDAYGESEGRLRFVCYGLGEKEVAAYFRQLEGKGWKKPERYSEQERTKTFTWKGRKCRASIEVVDQEKNLTTFRASYEPEG